MRTAHSLLRLVSILLDLAQGALQFLLLGTRSSAALKAENIFLRKQLALYLEREAKPQRATDATRLSMVLLVEKERVSSVQCRETCSVGPSEARRECVV